MKEKTKELAKKYLIGFILGVVSAGAIAVYAKTYFPSNDVTYDNTASGLSSTNVQGAIDELYGVCFPPTAGDTILDNVDIVTSGDGLYEDEYEEGKYTYKGGNPKNYVTFNNEYAGWRIISINSDGTIKIMRTADINTSDNLAWDTSGSYGNNNWARPSSLNTYLNSTYYNGLSSTAQSQIVAKAWSIGSVTYNDSNITNTISNENSKKWNGKVGLVTTSEYIRSNSNTNFCGTIALVNKYYSTCSNSSWMFNNDNWWTLSPYSNRSDLVLYVGGKGLVDYDIVNYSGMAVRISIYLSSEVQITGGTGTESDPYTIN